MKKVLATAVHKQLRLAKLCGNSLPRKDRWLAARNLARVWPAREITASELTSIATQLQPYAADALAHSNSTASNTPPTRKGRTQPFMPGIYEDVPIGDMSYDADEQLYQYQCPCGDLFEITLEELWDGDDVAHCPSCTLKVRVIFDKEQLPPLPPPE